MKRKGSDEVPPSGSKRPNEQWSLGTNPSLQLGFIDKSGIDRKISPERWELIEERVSDGHISSIGWSKATKVV